MRGRSNSWASGDSRVPSWDGFWFSRASDTL
jgi:hypothetical protein